MKFKDIKVIFLTVSIFLLISAVGVANAKVDDLAIITVLDLDGDGIETTEIKSGAYFDHDANGFAEQTGWVGADDGILVLDYDGNGAIDDGKEVFGNHMSINGKFAQGGLILLKGLDKNRDGKINAKDPMFSKLKVWQDIDGDGYSSSEELFSLKEKGIRAILLDYKDSATTAADNKILRISSYEKDDGTTGQIADVMVQTDKMYTIANKWLEVPSDIKSLPDLQGFGNVHDLHQAMVKDSNGKLIRLIRMAISENNPEVRTAIFEQLLFKWVGADIIKPASRGGNIDARRLMVLEKFFGEEFLGLNRQSRNPHENAGAFVNEAYIRLLELIYAQFMAQTHLKELYGSIKYSWDNSTQTMKSDLSPTIEKLQALINNNENQGKIILKEFARTLVGLTDEDNKKNMFDLNEFSKAFSKYGNALHCIGETKQITGENMGTNIYGYIYPNVIKGTANKDIVLGWVCDDEIYGEDGADVIYGSAGNDLLDGGLGNDKLYGGSGDDTYVFGKGYGTDTIYEYDNSKNIVRFKDGIILADLEFVVSKAHYVNDPTSKSLVVNIKNTNDSLIIREWHRKDIFTIVKFVFNNGDTLMPEDILKLAKDQPSQPKQANTKINAVWQYVDNNRYLLILIGVVLLLTGILLKLIRLRKAKNTGRVKK